MKNKKVLVAITSAILVVVFAVGVNLYKAQEEKKLGFMAQENAETFIRDYSPTLGSDDAKVYLVEFLDPECESCRAFFPYVKKLLKEFPGQIKLVVRYMPFHKNSRFMIKILEATRKQGKYWKALETVFYYQPNWGNHQNPNPELIWDYLPDAGVDVAQVKRDMNDPEFVRRINQDEKDGKSLGVRATPSFYVNGKPLKSFGYAQLRELVMSEL